MPLISIIVPVYNAETYLPETIASVQAQDFTDWELLLVDDCSSDKSREIARQAAASDQRIRPISQPENAGAAQARNRGLDEARGRYIAFLDADDIWRQKRLSSCLKALDQLSAQGIKGKNGSPIGFVFSGYEFADCDGRGLGVVVRVPKKLDYHEALKNTTIFTSTVLFDTEVTGKDILHMPLVKSEDTATWWQILKAGYTAVGIDRNLVLYRRSAGTLSANKGEAIRRMWNLYRNVEGLSLPYSAYNFCFYALRAVLRRI